VNIGAGLDDPQNNMPFGAAGFQTYITSCALKAKTATTSRSWIAQQWITGMFGRSLGNTLLAPNSPYPNCNRTSGNGDFDNSGVFGMSSFHSGGANISMCDGSVRFLKTSTSLQTVWAIGSRSQAEVVDSNSY